MTVTTGTWSIGGFKLPDFGLTEKFGIGTPNPNRSLTIPVSVNNGQIQGTPLYTQPQTQPINTTPKNDNLNVPSTPTSNNPQTYINQVNSTTDQYNSLIEQDYNNAIGQLSNQESDLRSQAGIATNEIGADYGNAIAQLGSEQSTAQQGVQSQLNTGETNAKTATQQARDLFRQTQQSNIAQLSALGISSSSVSEALAERLGVETARRLSGITGSLNEIRQNAASETSRINNYYQQKKTALDTTVANEKAKIQQALVSGLSQINSARTQAATDKARARLDLLTNAQNQINQIVQTAQQFDNSLKAWATQKAQTLQEAYNNPQALQSFLGNLSTIQSAFNPSKFNITPTINYNNQGQLSGQWNIKPKDQIDSGVPSASNSPIYDVNNQAIQW